MQRFLKGLVVLGIGLGLGGIAEAKGASPGGHHSGGHAGGAHSNYHGTHHAGGAFHGNYRSGHPGAYHNYHQRYGHQFRHGYYYFGRNHHHWSYSRWDGRYGCTLYYDPYVSCYYYWCEPDGCYYPVSYVPYNRYAWTTAGEQPVNGNTAPPPPAPGVR